MQNILGLKTGVQEKAIAGITDPIINPELDQVLKQDQIQSGIENPTTLKSRNSEAEKNWNVASSIRQQKGQFPLYEVDAFIYSLHSKEEIGKKASVNCTNPDREGPNTVRDLRFGPRTNNQLCGSCHLNIDQCPQHDGYIDIPPIFNPICINMCVYVLTISCHKCAGLLITDEEYAEGGFSKLKGAKCLQALSAFILKSNKHCRRLIDHNGEKIPCPGQGIPIPHFVSLKENQDEFVLKYSYGKASGQQHLMYPSQALTIIDAITDQHALMMGYYPSFKDPKIPESHPRNMIMERVIVMSYGTRPDLMMGDKANPDSMSTAYIEMIKAVRDYNNAKKPEERIAINKNIYLRVRAIMRSKATKGGRKEVSDIRKKINGKKGLIRGNMMGKRVNYAGRSVVGPGNDLRVDVVGVPQEMVSGDKLTYHFTVNPLNIKYLQEQLELGRVTHIIPKTGKKAGERVIVRGMNNKLNYRLRLGDQVDRVLSDGDWIIANRQPSIHKQSILGARAKIIPERINRINLSLTTPFNADFDGDELNIHVPQTVEAINETATLLSVQSNLMNEESNRPMIAFVIDSIYSIYLLTFDPVLETMKKDFNYNEMMVQYNNKKFYEKEKRSETPEEKAFQDEEKKRRAKEYDQAVKERKRKRNQADTLYDEFMDRFINFLELHQDKSTEELEALEEYQKLKQENEELEELVGIVKPEIFELCLDTIKGRPQLDTLAERARKHGVPWQTKRLIFSASLPEDFYFSDGSVLIVDGILVRGILNKSIMGTEENGVISEMYKQYESGIRSDFMTDLQFVLREFLDQMGLTVGLEDCLPDNYAEYQDMLMNDITDAQIKVMRLQAETLSNEIEEEKRERDIMNILNIAKQYGDTIVSYRVDPTKNGFIKMSSAGSKGKTGNFAQIMSALGQQQVNGARIPTDLPGKRTLPIYEVESRDPVARGFCSNSYLKGLRNDEFFFHAAANREGIADTAIGTAKSGGVAHVLGKVSEDVHTSGYGCVETTDGTIIQPIYGEDGFSAAEVSRLSLKPMAGTINAEGKMNYKKILFFRNLKQVAGKINARYGYYE